MTEREDRIAVFNEEDIYDIIVHVQATNPNWSYHDIAKAIFDRLCSEIKKQDKKPVVHEQQLAQRAKKILNRLCSELKTQDEKLVIYKVGDSVKVRHDLIENETYPTVLLHPLMVQYLGKEAKIKAIHSLSFGKVYELDIAPNWSWSWQMLEQND